MSKDSYEEVERAVRRIDDGWRARYNRLKESLTLLGAECGRLHKDGSDLRIMLDDARGALEASVSSENRMMVERDASKQKLASVKLLLSNCTCICKWVNEAKATLAEPTPEGEKP